MEKKFLQKMIQLALAGGKLSLKMMQNSKPCLKPDNSVLTKADLAVSKLIKNGLREFAKNPDHLFIDEEDQNAARYFETGVIDQKKYIWISDPIDGTRNFANRLPIYGVSLGLLKDRKPWLGVIYFPVLDEMFYCDGKKAYFVKAATSRNPKKNLVKFIDQTISRQSIFYGNDSFFKNFEWDFDLCQMMLPSCAVADLCFPAIGRGAGCFFNASIWDFAGSWPIFRAAGLELRHFQTGEVLDCLKAELFNGNGPKAWKLRSYYILSSQRNWGVIQKAMKAKH